MGTAKRETRNGAYETQVFCAEFWTFQLGESSQEQFYPSQHDGMAAPSAIGRASCWPTCWLTYLLSLVCWWCNLLAASCPEPMQQKHEKWLQRPCTFSREIQESRRVKLKLECTGSCDEKSELVKWLQFSWIGKLWSSNLKSLSPNICWFKLNSIDRTMDRHQKLVLERKEIRKFNEGRVSSSVPSCHTRRSVTPSATYV